MPSHIFGTGIDIVDVVKFEKTLKRSGQRFLSRIFTKVEQKYVKDKRFPGPHLAARFAAKEALRKAFGDLWDDAATWKHVEVFNHSSGRPMLRLLGPLEKLRDENRLTDIWVSLSHTRDWAVAYVLVEREGRLNWPH
jgi:holo-[acyl-carrier protein] synthase